MKWFNQKSIKTIPNYTLFNKDREQVIGGWIAIYVRNDIQALEVGKDGLVQVVGEQIWCKIVTDMDSLLIGCIYRAPYSNYEIKDEINSTIALAKKISEREKVHWIAHCWGL